MIPRSAQDDRNFDGARAGIRAATGRSRAEELVRMSRAKRPDSEEIENNSCESETVGNTTSTNSIEIQPIVIMPSSTTLRRAPAPSSDSEAPESFSEPVATAPWLAVVAEKVKAIRYGVVQIVIHDSKVVQIERTERTRFDVPQAAQGR